LKKFKVKELLPRPNKAYGLYLGSIPLKHKCDLLVNIRSEASHGEVIGGLVNIPLLSHNLFISSSAPIELTKTIQVLFFLRIGARTTFNFPIHLDSPLHLIENEVETDMKPSISFPSSLSTVPSYSLPKFPPGTYWLPAPHLAPIKETPMFRFAKSMSLKEPNQYLYTRPRLGLGGNGEMAYGDKTFHYEDDDATWKRLARRQTRAFGSSLASDVRLTKEEMKNAFGRDVSTTSIFLDQH
jgi:hypothetical protein